MEHKVRKTAMKLADGRDLFYFDDSEPYVSGEKTRRTDDPRPLPNRFEPVDGKPVEGPIMRRDPLTGDWIPMAAHRMNRTFLPPADANPLGPARPGATYQDGEIPDTDYDVVVFENRFPSLMEIPATSGQIAPTTHPEGEELFLEQPANGRCEVVCFGPDLNTNLVSMGPRRMRTVIEAWADRTAALSAIPQVKQVFVFENHGQDIGVTLSHPHGQIYAYPYLTPKTAAMLRQARALAEQKGNPAANLIESVRDAEMRAGTRVVAQNDHWVLYVPVAARWPLEFHLVPKRLVPDFAALDEAQREALADIYLKMLILGNHFHREPGAGGKPGDYIPINYISAWHQAPVDPADGREQLGLHCEFFSFLRAPGKLKYLAGSESGMAAWISDTTPEKIAARAREAAQECVELGAFAGLDHPTTWK